MSHIGRCSSAYEGPDGPGHRLREPHAVLVREQVEVGVELGLVGEVQRPEPPPRHQVGRDRLRGLGPERPVGHVGHQVQLQRRHPRHPRVLDAGVAGPALPARVGLEHDAAALHADRHAVRERPPRPARRATRCRRRPAAEAGAGARRACGPRPGSARPRPRWPRRAAATSRRRPGSARTGTSRPSSLDRRADLRGDEAPLEQHEQHDRGCGQRRRRRRGSPRTGSPRPRRRC